LKSQHQRPAQIPSLEKQQRCRKRMMTCARHCRGLNRRMDEWSLGTWQCASLLFVFPWLDLAFSWRTNKRKQNPLHDIESKPVVSDHLQWI
jgi:hypothetical protein